MQQQEQIKCFCGYTQADQVWFQRFLVYIFPLQKRRNISFWDEQNIYPGQDRQKEVLTHLYNSDVILLFISPDFLASEFFNENEVQQGIQEKIQQGTPAIPILLKICDWKDTFLGNLQELPKDGGPITSHEKGEGIFFTVIKEIDALLEKHLHTSPSFEDKPPITENEDARKRYLEQVHKRYSSVTLPIEPSERLSLQAIYQPLVLRRDPLAVEDLEQRQRRKLLGEEREEAERKQRDHLQGESQKPSQPVFANHVEDALSKTPEGYVKGRIVILGGPGAGKTTTLKHLISNRALQALEQAPDQPAAFLPIFISLPDLALSGKPFSGFLEDVVEHLLVNKSFADVLWKEIQRGRAFVALDGLDEVAPAQRQKIIELINLLASDPGNNWLVGSRFTEYKGGQLKRGQFAEWELRSMTPALRRDLVTRLLPRLTHSLPEAANISPFELVNQIEKHPQAATWGENPLLLSLVAAVFVRTGNLPASRSALYHTIVEAILAFKGTGDRIDLRDQQKILAEFSLQLYDKERTQIFLLDDLLIFLQNRQSSLRKDPAEMVRTMRGSGILDEVTPDKYSFRHRTFHEYLVAFELAQQLIGMSEKEQKQARVFVWDKRAFSRWTEVLRLMVGVLQLSERKGQKEALLWLKRLIGQKDDPGDLGLKLALTSLAEITDGGVWEADILKQVRELEDQVVLRWVQKLREAADHERRPQLEKFQRLASDVTYLHLAEKETTIHYLVQALKNPHRHIQRAAAETLKILGLWVPVDIWQMLLEDADSSTRLLALETLIKGEKNSLPVKLLINLVDDSDLQVRQLAIKTFLALDDDLPSALLLSLLNHPNQQIRQFATTLLVKQHVQVPLERLSALLGDSDSSRRQVAIKALKMVRKDLSVELVFSLLENTDWQVHLGAIYMLILLGEQVPLHRFIPLFNDSDWRVRQVAIQASKIVKEGFPEDAVVSLLKDSEKHVRLEAMDMLVKRGKRIPIESLFVLLEDHSSSVRHMAIGVLVKQGDSLPTRYLLQLLEDSNQDVYQAAIDVLARQGNYIPLERLLRLLKNSHSLVRQMVIETLMNRGERVPTDYLLNLVKESDQGVCQTAIDVLVKQGDFLPTEHLLHLLEENVLSSVHEWAIKTLAKQGGYKSTDLLYLLKNSHALVCHMVSKMLVSQSERVPTERLLELLQHPDPNVYQASIELLMRQGERIPFNRLLSLLEDAPSSTCQAIIELLIRQGTRISVDQLLAFLVQPDWKRRRIAIEMFIKQGKQMPLHALRNLLEHSEVSVKQSVIEIIAHQYEQIPGEIWRSLLELPGSHTCREVIQVLANFPANRGPISDDYPDWQVCSTAIQVLRIQGENIPLDRLLALMPGLGWEESKIVMQEVERQVALFSTDRLVPLLSHSHRPVYLMAIEMLLQRGEAISLDQLLDLLKSFSSWQNRSNTSAHLIAIEVLMQREEAISLDQLLDLLESSSSSQVHQAVGRMLEQRREDVSLDLLLGLLRGSNQQVYLTIGKVVEQRGEGIAIDLLLEWLNDSSSSVRQVARSMLKQRGKSIPMPVLFEWLDDSGSLVSQIASNVLEQRREDIPIDHLPYLLKHPDLQLRSIAIEALPKCKEQLPVEQWFTFLENANWQVSQMVSEVLESLGEQVSDDICLSLLDHSAWQVRLEAIKILEKRAELAPTRRLLDALNDPDHQMQQAASKVLSDLEKQVPAETWLHLLRDDHYLVRLTAITILKRQQIYPSLDWIFALLEEDPYEQVCQVAREILEDTGADWPIEIWLGYLEDANPYRRQAAPEVLIKRNQEVSFDYLLQVLERSDPSFHSGIMKVVESLKEQVPVETWLDLREYPHPSMRLIALQAIESQGASLPLEELRSLLSEPNWDVQQVASQILRNMSPYWSIEVWLDLLVGSNWHIQQVVVEVLIERNQEVSLDYLLQLLEHPDASFHLYVMKVVESLKKHVPVEKWFTLRRHPDPSVRLTALQAIESQGTSLPWEDLSVLLDDSYSQVRQVAIEIIKHQGEQTLIENWLELLKYPEVSVRQTAMEFLGNHREQVPLEYVLPLLEDAHNMSRMAVEFLQKEKQRVSIHLLIRFLYQTNGEVQERAMKVLKVLDEVVPHDILTDLLSYQSSQVRQIALDIARKQHPEMLSDLSNDAHATLNGHISGRIFGTLAKAYIADSIGHLGVASPMLLDILARFLDWPHWQVQWQAARSLGRLQRSIPNDAIQRLHKLRRNPDLKMRAVRDAADDALAEILSLETSIEDD